MSEAMQLMVAAFGIPDGAKNTFKRVKEDKLRRGDAAILKFSPRLRIAKSKLRKFSVISWAGHSFRSSAVPPLDW
ncbi:MAG: hypothetical protein ACFBSG_20260 [Leptolyngbyaceae cyanobacterium]